MYGAEGRDCPALSLENLLLCSRLAEPQWTQQRGESWSEEACLGMTSGSCAESQREGCFLRLPSPPVGGTLTGCRLPCPLVWTLCSSVPTFLMAALPVFSYRIPNDRQLLMYWCFHNFHCSCVFTAVTLMLS